MADEEAMHTDAIDAAAASNNSAYIAHKLLTSSLAVYPPLPLSNGTAVPSPSLLGDVAHVLVCRGKWSELMGHGAPGGRMHLHVEEWVWLLEQGALEVMYDGMPLSVEESYTVMMNSTGAHGLVHPAAAYAVYCSLRNNGYIVMRPQQFTAAHTTLKPVHVSMNNRSSASASASIAAASSPPVNAAAASAASVYAAVVDYPPPQGKKLSRRDFGRPMAPTPTKDELSQERDRLRQMQGWIPSFDASTGEMGPTAAAASAAAASDAAGGSTAAAVAPSAAATPSIPSIPSAVAPPLPADVSSLLSTPCDCWCVWLPGGTSGKVDSGGGGGAASGFKKSNPSLPDFLCLVLNPTLNFEALWAARTHVPRRVVQQFRQQRKHTHAAGSARGVSPTGSASQSHLPTSHQTCLADALALMYDLSAELAAATPLGSGPPPMVPLRIGRVPEHQQRVFFIDTPFLQPPPSCMELTEHSRLQQLHAATHNTAAGLSIFQ